MIALLVGLLGGMLAGMALSHVRLADESDAAPSRPPGPSTPAERPTTQPTPQFEGAASDSETPALTDEEEIVQLLVENGGRMKQSRIVTSTDWSKAKVSRLLSKMEDRDEITKLTIGRENLIFLGTVDERYASGNTRRG